MVGGINKIVVAVAKTAAATIFKSIYSYDYKAFYYYRERSQYRSYY